MFLQIIAAAGIGATSAMLANQSVAIFNDGFRPVFADYLSGGMDRKTLATTGFALSIGLIFGYGMTTSIAVGVLLMHVYLLAGDMIGTFFPDDKKGMFISGFIGAIWAVAVFLGLEGMYKLFNSLPVNFLDQLGGLANIIIATFPLFPAIAAANQFGAKKGSIVAIVIGTTYLTMKTIGSFTIAGMKISLSPEGMSMLVGMIVLIIIAAKSKADGSEEGGITSLFGNNVKRIRKNWPVLALSGGFVALGTTLFIITIGPTSAKLFSESKFIDAAIFSVTGAIGYIPLVYTTAIVTGVFTPASRFVLAIGMLMPAFGLPMTVSAVLSFIGGAVVASCETLIIGAVGSGMDKYPSLREMGNHIRKSMSDLLEVAMIVGSFIVSGQIAGLVGLQTLGYIIVMGAYLLNKMAKKPIIMQMAVGPVATIVIGILVNVLVVLNVATLVVV